MELNKYQTPIEDLGLDAYPEEVREQFFDFISTVPYIKNCIDPKKKRACELQRDKSGKIIVDITQPHILEDMDYFRPTAIHFQKYGCYTKLRPNPNPNSEYGKWIREELKRCYYGYVRPSDGEWITGDNYYFWNYAPMSLAKKEKGSKKASRVIDFPRVWEGHYYKFHYLQQARDNGKHALELASRSKGKSFCGASMLSKRFILGESPEVNKKVTCYITAADKKYLVSGDQTLDKFQFDIDWAADNTQFPKRRLISSIANMQWTMGYKDLDYGTNKGTLNSVIGISSKDDESKLRGSRGVLYVLEEIGSFPALLALYNNLRPSVEDGEDVFGMIYGYGTAGDSQSDFSAAQEMMYNPTGYNIYRLPNVFDKEGQGSPNFVFFFPGYINRADCYDEDGNSDVTKALLQILQDRYIVKYNSTDINTITKRVAEIPITPQEAVLKTVGNKFPVVPLTERINELDNNPNAYAGSYIGDLILNSSGEVEFKMNNKTPIRKYPLKDNKAEGALEIFQLPEKNNEGKVFSNRYIIGNDPVDDDQSETMSLTSTFVLDLFTDKIVAEYTGRQAYADDNFEIVRKLCLFYNAKCLYESNKKGIFAYFSKHNCLHLLADTPEYLKDREIIKSIGYGNKAKGVNAVVAVNNFANDLIREWLLKPVTKIVKEGDEDKEITVPNLFHIKSRALLQELVSFNPIANFDRVRALGMVMLYREEQMIRFQGDTNKIMNNSYADKNYLGNDKFFTTNYDDRFIRRS